MNKTLINLKLAYLRKVKHMTQEELADVIGTSFQTISKWENGVTMPDISVLPVLSDFFNVSVDQLLGLKPLSDEEYISDGTDTKVFWDNHLEYLIRTRSGTWNADYMRFLVRDVWKINKPIKVLDCGCGFGYIAVLLMPNLPEGSTYTGIDFSASMTQEAAVYLKKHGINGTVINGDFITFDPKDKYDMVICKSVLRHLGDSEPFIKKMIECANKNALIVCADSNRELECCGLYIDGLNYGYLCDHEGAIKHWQTEIDNGKRDYAAAMRSAYVMRKLGLSDVDVRMNDRVSFIYPEQADYMSRYVEQKEVYLNSALLSKLEGVSDAAEKLLVAASLGQPVLSELRNMAAKVSEDDSYSRLILSLGLIFCGDYETAREMYLTSESDSGDTGFAALRAIVATYVDRDNAGDIIDALIKSNSAMMYLRFAPYAYIKNRCDLSSEALTMTIHYGDKSELVTVTGLEDKLVNIISDEPTAIWFEPHRYGIEVMSHYVEGREYIEDGEENIPVYLEGDITENGEVYLCIDLAAFDSDYGTLSVVIPDALAFTVDRELPKHYYERERIVTNRITVMKSVRLGESDYTGQLRIPLTVKHLGDFVFEEVVFTADDGRIGYSEQIVHTED